MAQTAKNKYEAVVIGVSAGGVEALKSLLPQLPATFSLAVIIVHHMAENVDNFLTRYLGEISTICVKEAQEKENILPSIVYIAPAGSHLLIEMDKSFSLSVDPPVNFSRPSIDVLFESAAEAYGKRLIGVVLTGANSDGSLGLKKIKQYEGCAIVQNPKTAKSGYMPLSAINTVKADYIVDLEKIIPLLINLSHKGD